MVVAATQAERLNAVLEAVDLERVRVSASLDPARRIELGQFLTPHPVARQLAGMLPSMKGCIRVADPGAGIGSLGAAVVGHLLSQKATPQQIVLTAWELDEQLWPSLARTMAELAEICELAEVDFVADTRHSDFLADGVDLLTAGPLLGGYEAFDAVVINPPYRKINTQSVERKLCRQIGLETSNLYAAFLAVAADLLRAEGQMVAIVPRSFTNGTYFTPFRRHFTDRMAFRRLHVYESRSLAFSDDAVLQENIVFHAKKTTMSPDSVSITSNTGPGDGLDTERQVAYAELIRPDDPSRVIHLIEDETGRRIAERIDSLPCSLSDLRLAVSTGRVVDFRATPYLRSHAGLDTAPLIYPGHLREGRVVWPMQSGKKPNALFKTDESRDLLVPEGLYVLTKRFSAKEERRRIVAALYDPEDVSAGPVGFENHLNYYHRNGVGLDRTTAWGLRAFLNSTLVDMYFRQFSGHTQVNAGDLRRLRYPSIEQLHRLGGIVNDQALSQAELDSIIHQELFVVSQDLDPVRVHQRVQEAISVLKQLGLPRGQLNERSGLTLLALLGLGPDEDWSAVADPLIGITPMMDFFKDQYGKTYAPNTRETVRRFSVHQFVDAGLVVQNPDEPSRPVNSPKAVYQIETSALALLQTFGTPAWDKQLSGYLATRETLREKYAAERAMSRIPVSFPNGREFSLSGGGQNVLVKHIIEDFCPRWTPGAAILYLGDTGDKFAHIDLNEFTHLNISIEEHGKMPDIVVHDVHRNWLVVIEAVTSHGPVDGKRRTELQDLFAGSSAPLVYLTAFLDRQTMMRWLPDIAWETEVWCASDPTHLIHFNGERYLGPYQS